MSVRGYVELVRPPNSILSGVGAAFSVLVYAGYVANYVVLSLAFATGFLVTAASMIVNDVVDLDVDMVNKPWKPLPRGAVRKSNALKLALILVLVAITVNAAVGPAALLVALAYCAVGVSYSFLRRHCWSHALVALSTTGPVVYGYVVAGLPGGDLSFTILFSSVVAVVTLGREFLKAVQDYEGDSRHGYKTLATVLGLEGASRVVALTGIMGVLLAAYTATLDVGPAYRVLILIAAATYLYGVYVAYSRRWNKKALERSRKLMLWAMFIGMVAFWLSKAG